MILHQRSASALHAVPTALLVLMGIMVAIQVSQTFQQPARAAGEDTVTLSWSGGTGAIANENPKVTYVYLGQSHTVPLSQTPGAFTVDDGTVITAQSPWESNAIMFTASPLSVTAVPGLTEDFAYGTTAPESCTQMGSNVTALFQSGQCFIPGVFWSFGNILGAPVLAEFLVIIPGIVAYIKPRNGVIALIMIALIQGSITQFLGIATPITLTIVAASAVLTISGGIIKVLWGGGGGAG